MPLSCSYSPNYFSISDILVTQERTTCKFLKSAPNLGNLNPNAEGNDLKAGTVLELPLWLTQPLDSGQRIVAPELPKVYKESYREILKADASAVNLHKFSSHFYELGLYVKKYDIRGDVTNILLQTFQDRFRKIMDLADNTSSDSSVIHSLDITERRLFADGQSTRLKLNEWLTESATILEAANMVINFKKRKRVCYEDLV